MTFQVLSLPFALAIIVGQETASLNAYEIENGWYAATVQYHNSSTYTKSTYTLNVKVQYDRVVEIDFGNGGSVHSGYNSSGYQYSGGYLQFEYDYDQNVVAASTTVRVTTDSFTVLTYSIRIE